MTKNIGRVFCSLYIQSMTDKFLQEDVPLLLGKLTESTAPLWGQMNALQMVDHVYHGFLLSQNSMHWPLRTPLENLPGALSFLRSEKPLPRNAPLPMGFVEERIQPSTHIQEASIRLTSEINSFLTAIDREGYEVFHPDFGKLNAEDALILMRKHTRHHLAQFGLVER